MSSSPFRIVFLPAPLVSSGSPMLKRTRAPHSQAFPSTRRQRSTSRGPDPTTEPRTASIIARPALRHNRHLQSSVGGGRTRYAIHGSATLPLVQPRSVQELPFDVSDLTRALRRGAVRARRNNAGAGEVLKD